MANKITYDDKVNVRPVGADPTLEWEAGDANEVKANYNNLVDELGLGGVDDNVRIVSINTAGATNKIKGVLDAILDSSVNKPYLVLVRPGSGTTEYVEDNFTVPAYTSLVSDGGGSVTAISANTTTGNFITMSEGSSISGFSVKDKTSGVAVDVSGTGIYNITRLSLNNCDTGIVINNSVAKVEIDKIIIDGTITNEAIYNQAGNVDVSHVNVINNTAIGVIFRSSGVNALSTVRDVLSFSSNVTTGMLITDSSRANAYGISLVGMVDGIIQENGANITLANIKLFNAQNDGYRCNDVGVASELSVYASQIDGSSNLDVNVLCPLSLFQGDVQADESKVYTEPTATLLARIINTFPGDSSSHFLSELVVGSQVRPFESVFGEGDSHINEYVYTQNPSSVFVDVTSEAISVSASAYTFPGVAINNAIYVANGFIDTSGDPIPFYGVKVNIDTAAVIGAGEIITEYWNGVAWTEFSSSTNLSGGSYWKYAKDYFSRSGNYHIKFDPDILVDWAANDPVSLGFNRYWMRFRVSSVITSVPVLQQNKISTNRSEKNPDGTDEYHGLGRTIKKVTLDSAGPIEGNMQDSDIYVDQNVGVAFVNNRFTSTSDIRGYKFELPEDCDTSGKLIVVWKGKFAGAGSPQFTVRLNIIQPGGAYTNSEPGASGNTKTSLSTIRAVTANVREDFRVDVDISEAIPAREDGFGDEIWITLQLTTRSTSGNFDITGLSANYLSDFNGRHQ